MKPMSPATRQLHLDAIRLLKGLLTAWEKWLHAEYASSLPEGTVKDAMDLLRPDKAARK